MIYRINRGGVLGMRIKTILFYLFIFVLFGFGEAVILIIVIKINKSGVELPKSEAGVLGIKKYSKPIHRVRFSSRLGSSFFYIYIYIR